MTYAALTQPAEAERTAAPVPSAASRVEIGVVYTGRPRDAAYGAVRRAAERLQRHLQSVFPEFQWHLPTLCRERQTTGVRIEPAELLQVGTENREAHRWDFVVLATPQDLVTRYKPFALAVVSRSLDLAVVSLSRLSAEPESDESEQEDVVARLEQLILHTLGHLNGLTDVDDSRNVMRDLHTAGDLDDDTEFDESQLAILRENLRQIADVRLEERADGQRSFVSTFYLRSMWMNRHEIFDAVWQAKPWEFPIRLARLTAAAVSAALILLITAETWDLALNQSGPAVSLLLGLALLFTTGFVVKRQRLLITRRKPRVTEQTVISNIAGVTIVFLGMATTALLLFALSFGAAAALFPKRLIQQWAASAGAGVGVQSLLLMAAFVASVGILIGALGASFEEQHHFRHVVLVDEEV